MLEPPLLNRRVILAGAGKCILAVLASAEVARATSSEEGDVTSWVEFLPDGSVRILYAPCEMGQGVSSSLPQILADALDLDWGRVSTEAISTNGAIFGNPVFDGVLYTGGSTSVEVYFDIMTKAGLRIRTALLQTAAEHLSADPEWLSTRAGFVLDHSSGSKVSYTDLVRLKIFSWHLGNVDLSAVWPPSTSSIIGSNCRRKDIPSKTTGEAVYGIDIRIPGMAYAIVLRAPIEGGAVVSIGESTGKNGSGIVDVINFSDRVAVIADTAEDALIAADNTLVEWSSDTPFAQTTSESAKVECIEAVRGIETQGVIWDETGRDARTSAKTHEAVYSTQYLYHGQMEPLSAAADIDPITGRNRVWAGTQSQTFAIETAARTLGVPQEKIEFHQMMLGGSFGRRAEANQAVIEDAVLISERIGRPVKVIWRREDDIRFGAFRPVSAQYVGGRLDDDGLISDLHLRVAVPSVLAFINDKRWKRNKPKDIISMNGAVNTLYGFNNYLAEHVITPRRARINPWRSIGVGYIAFAIESFIDEMAEVAGRDPVSFRMALCRNNDRAVAVLAEAANMSEWKTGGDRARQLGVALTAYRDALAAAVVEISTNDTKNAVKVEKIWIAADIGLVISPDAAMAQLEGGAIFGFSAAMSEKIDIEGGQVQQSNYYDYPIAGMSTVPEVHAKLIYSDRSPKGVGELSVPLIAPAIANAVASSTGKRLRDLPFGDLIDQRIE